MACALFCWPAAAAAQHDGDILVGAAPGGQLATAYDFTQRVVVSAGPSFGGVTIWSGTDPGIDLLVDPEDGLAPLTVGTELALELTAVEADVSVKIGDAILDAPGASALLGVAPAVHVHPEWRLVLPDGALATRAVSFRLISSSAAVSASVVYTALVTNDPTPPPTNTTTTTSLAPGPATTSTSLAPDACTLAPLDAVVCQLDRFAAMLAGTPTAPPRIGRRLAARASAIRKLIVRGAGNDGRGRARRLERAARRLDGLVRAVERREPRLPDGTAEALRAFAVEAAAALGRATI
jgi:hypothetical protein